MFDLINVVAFEVISKKENVSILHPHLGIKAHDPSFPYRTSHPGIGIGISVILEMRDVLDLTLLKAPSRSRLVNDYRLKHFESIGIDAKEDHQP